MARQIVYRLKEDVDYNKLADLGYDVIPYELGAMVFFKIVPQDLEGDAVQRMLQNFYLNPKWKEKYYTGKNKKILKNNIGLEYDKDGNIKYNEKFETMLKSWRIEINTEDNWLGFCNMDSFDQSVFCGKAVLDKYCKEEIETLKKEDLIEEYILGVSEA